MAALQNLCMGQNFSFAVVCKVHITVGEKDERVSLSESLQMMKQDSAEKISQK